jgi:flagellin
MSFRVNNNIDAFIAQRNLTMTGMAMSKSIEKLSSGLRINRAGDDAAGLSISEKLKAQVTGLNQATRNAQDGISMVQTTEGALNEVQSILQRMRELGVQGSNGTLSTDDRNAISSELGQLKSEIDRIAKVTDFNGLKLLSGQNATSASNGAIVGNMTASGAITTDLAAVTASFNQGVNTLQAGTYTLTFTSATSGSVSATGTVQSVSVFNGSVTQSFNVSGTGLVNLGNGVQVSISNTVGNGDTLSFTVSAGAVAKAGAQQSILQIGANSSSAEQLNVSVSAVGTSYIGDGTGSGNPNQYSVKTLSDAIGQVQNLLSATATSNVQNAMLALVDSSAQALKDISGIRGVLGASQNRLEHTIANLGVAQQNLSASQSQIADVNMASEMVNFTKTQILQNAGTSILTQANQAPQAVLKLLG